MTIGVLMSIEFLSFQPCCWTTTKFIMRFYITGADNVYTVLRMKKECQFKVFDVWNKKNTYCGSPDGSTDIFRHGYIDNMNFSCISYVCMVFCLCNSFVKKLSNLVYLIPIAKKTFLLYL